MEVIIIIIYNKVKFTVIKITNEYNINNNGNSFIYYKINSITSHTIRNVESAKISVPSQLAKIESKTGTKYIWRTNLSASEKYWEGKKLYSILLYYQINK